MNDAAITSRLVFNGAIPGSPADRAGMMKNDVILSVNGNAVNGFDDYIQSLNTIGEDRIQKMDVMRAGKLIEVVLQLGPKTDVTPDYNGIVDQLKANGSLPADEPEQDIMNTKKIVERKFDN